MGSYDHYFLKMQQGKNLEQLDHLSDISQLLKSNILLLGVHWIHSNNM